MTLTFQRARTTNDGLEASGAPSLSAALVAGHDRPFAAFAFIPLFHVFVFLQVLDALTTVGVLQRGGFEANPIVNMLMELGPVNGILIAKLLVVVVGAAILWNGRQRVLFIANYIYAGIICWNLIALVLVD